MEVPTIKIVSSDTDYGYVIINVSDFNPDTMVEFGVAPEEPVAPLEAKKAKK